MPVTTEPLRFRIYFTVLLLLSTIFSQPGVQAQQGDALLRKRIDELESENLALRKIIAKIQSQLSTVPKQSAQLFQAKGLRIVVLPGDWGQSQIEEMRRVCVSAANTIWSELDEKSLAPIHISRSNSGPISLYKRGSGYEYNVKLDTANRLWSQCAFQFAHEFCHILCNYRNVPNRQLWFEETLCECASLFALRRMSETWKTHPPYSNWKSYSDSLKTYATDRIQKYDDHNESVAEFFRKHQSDLLKSGTNRELNGYLAIKLLPLFEKDPKSWNAVRYINLGPKEENVTFESYIQGWYQRVPEEHKKLVRSIAKEFEIEVK